jgi:transposase
VFNALTYSDYLEQLMKRYYPQKMFLIQDNASYHKDSQVWDWFSEHRKNIQVNNLPPYSPEFNAVERLWHHTRVNATHNRYFNSVDDLENSLIFAFRSMQKRSSQIAGYLNPFQ